MNDQPIPDETRILRQAQSNLIALQAQRIALLEARVDAAAKVIANLHEENKKLRESGVPGEKVQVQA